MDYPRKGETASGQCRVYQTSGFGLPPLVGGSFSRCTWDFEIGRGHGNICSGFVPER